MTAEVAQAWRPKPVPTLPHARGCPCPNWAVAACSPWSGCGRLLPDSVWQVGRDLTCSWSGDSLYNSVKEELEYDQRQRENPKRRSEQWRARSDEQIGNAALEHWLGHDVGDLVAAVRHFEACDSPAEFGYPNVRRGQQPPRVYVLEDIAGPETNRWLRLGGSAATGKIDAQSELRTVERWAAARLLCDWHALAAKESAMWRLRREVHP